MAKSLERLWLNVGPAALRCLGPSQYAALMGAVARNAGAVAAKGDLGPVDRAMSRRVDVRFAGSRFAVDCRFADEVCREPSYTFGAVRELYIRNCYLRQPGLDPRSLRTVVDLGGNRGIFSLLAASLGARVVYVEPQSRYREVLLHNLRINGLGGVALEHVFVGNRLPGSAFVPEGTQSKPLEQLMAENGFDTLDFLKVDIEGSEFALFRDLTCLHRVRYISMEVHGEAGDIPELVARLRGAGFEVETCDRTFRPTAHVPSIEYLYATNPALAGGGRAA